MTFSFKVWKVVILSRGADLTVFFLLLRFGRNVQPLCLVPSRWTYPSLLNCTVAGWGSLGIALGTWRWRFWVWW